MSNKFNNNVKEAVTELCSNGAEVKQCFFYYEDFIFRGRFCVTLSGIKSMDVDVKYYSEISAGTYYHPIHTNCADMLAGEVDVTPKCVVHY